MKILITGAGIGGTALALALEPQHYVGQHELRIEPKSLRKTRVDAVRILLITSPNGLSGSVNLTFAGGSTESVSSVIG